MLWRRRRLQYGFKICFLRAAQRVHRGGGAVVNAVVAQFMLQEQPHSHFVCRAHHAGHGSARARRVHRKAQAGGLFIVGRFEAEVFELPEIEPVEHRLSALRISQRELNRQPHVRYAELGDDSSVHELYHRVYDALRVDTT